MHHTHHQLFLIEGLGEEVVGTNLETFHQVAGIVECCKENNGNVARLGVFLQNDSGIEAADIGHHDIQKNQIGLLFLGLLNALISIGSGAHLKLLISKQYLQ